MEHREAIRRAYFVDGKAIRQIAREFGHSRKTVRKAIASAEPPAYTLTAERPAPVLGPFKDRIDELLDESERLPRKQRYTGHKIFGIIRSEGYRGSASTVRGYISQRRAQTRRPPLYLPLEFDPGIDAQVDWGEGTCLMGGRERLVQLFYMRLCYSRRLFMMAFPAQKQEAFFEGHRRAFHHFVGVPHRITYDNLKTAVARILQGRGRQEQQAFVVFRSHYLFESRFTTPGQGHEKGSVEHGVGFGRRNFMVPLPEVDSFDELNHLLLEQCLADDARRVDRQPVTIGEAFEQEQPCLRAVPAHDFDCCTRRPVVLNPYSQIVFETNRYSVPVEEAHRNLLVKAYPFHVEIVRQDRVLCVHERCYEREVDIIDPLHYLPLLEQRLGAFEHAKPLRLWRAQWPPVYEDLLARLLRRWPEGRGLREFVRILHLHREHEAKHIEAAVTQALHYGCVHADGVQLCLHQLTRPERRVRPLEPGPEATWAEIGTQPIDLNCYNQLL